VRFWKLDGAGNDFVLIEPTPRPHKALARALCDRRSGVGADGLLVVDKKRRSFRYYNADGSAAFCGNGARCVAVWLSGGAKGALAFQGPTGPLLARILSKERAAVAMPEPFVYADALRLRVEGKDWKTYYADSGVPHAIVKVRGLDRFDVARIGREIRFHKAFGKAGANVDFVEKRGAALRVRTYERGVEAETLACGTGAVAAAAVATTFFRSRLPATVVPTSGQPLKLYREAGRLWLEGPVRSVFQGDFP
jgi:diaminopimelate epimerase